MKSRLLLFLAFFPLLLMAGPGDTVMVKTFHFDSNQRAGMYQFPDDTTKTWEKIIMLYSMRCKDGLISTGSNTNLGCGEWDYNCYTYITDSTQTDSLKVNHPSHVIPNFSGSLYYFTNNPVYQYTLYTQQSVQVDSIISDSLFSPQSGNVMLSHPLSAGLAQSQSQYLYTAQELGAAGLSAGDLHGLKLMIDQSGSTMPFLKVEIKAVSQSSLDANNPDTGGFTEVNFNQTNTLTGALDLIFHTPFTWDGSSNLIIRFTHTATSSGTDAVVLGDTAFAGAGLLNITADGGLNFNGTASAATLPAALNNQISQEISIAFWAKGDAVLPVNTTILEATDATGARQVNIHMPWGNSNLYWDCGNDGTGYDRINTGATSAEIEGNWVFWTFTKNAGTGEMSIYKNGSVWLTAGGRTKPISIQTMKLGSSVDGGLGWYGKLNEFSLWNKSLSAAEIAQIMMNGIDPAHPQYAHLLVYYPMDEASGSTLIDESPNGNSISLNNPNRFSLRGDQLYRNFTQSNERPNLDFVRAQYQTTVNTTQVLDSVLAPQTSITSYSIVSNNLVNNGPQYVWPAGWNFVLDPAGNVVDTLITPYQDSVIISTLSYHAKRPMKLELINFITPYGINLNMNGLIGKTWQFDVTDYAPILRGRKFMAMEGGNLQEDNDITFVFYEGTPARKVRSIKQIWPNATWADASYTDIVNNNRFEPRTLIPDAGASQFRVKSATSGHGQEGEFIPRDHTVTVNGTNFTRTVWTFCGENPVFPQGGTWVYDRAGWCPGAAVDLFDYEVTGLVSAGQPATFDYSLPAASGTGSSNYRINNQLVSYGPALKTLDAELTYIKRPSNRVEFERLNPICDEPVIGIKNTGSTALTSLEIKYGRKGGAMSTFNWTGNLAFLESTEITLPAPNWTSSTETEFIAWLAKPNGSTDVYAYNDTLRSVFVPPVVHPEKFIIEMKSNNYPNENDYGIMDAAGNYVFYRNNLAVNTLYRDTITLPPGCYQFKISDTGNDGLTWWANSAQGSGYVRFRNSNNPTIIRNFASPYTPGSPSDFGSSIVHNFTIGINLPVEEENVLSGMEVFPNPASTHTFITIHGASGLTTDIELCDLHGRLIKTERVALNSVKETLAFDTSELPSGLYFIRARSGKQTFHSKLVITR
jgi:hypothetical protein